MAAILLVEDDEAISQPLARALEREGHEVEIVADGLVAAAIGATGSHDLIILDLTLPSLDGLDVCRRIRHRGADHHVDRAIRGDRHGHRS
jgi:DNA-binding response OmpR family regulator